MSRLRVHLFVDGFNLYHALKELKDPPLKWLDLWTLGQRLIKPKTQILGAVHYFSAYAEWMPERAFRHRTYVAALESRGVKIKMGNFKAKRVHCKKCKTVHVTYEEKETVVNIAVAMVAGAALDQYDIGMLITRDSDLAPALRTIKAIAPEKRSVIVAPPKRGHSNELIQAADEKMKLNRDQIENCRLPPALYDTTGRLIAKDPYLPTSP